MLGGARSGQCLGRIQAEKGKAVFEFRVNGQTAADGGRLKSEAASCARAPAQL